MFKRLPKGENGGIQLLLIHNVEHLGKQGDLVEVKAGFALNYLLPQGLATVATDHQRLSLDVCEHIEDRLDEVSQIMWCLEDFDFFT